MSAEPASVLDESLPGSTENFSAIYRLYFKRLCLYALQFVREDSLAEDIVQSAFLKVWKKRHVINFNDNVNAFLYTVVRNESFNYLRSRRHSAANDLALEHLADESRIDELILSETLQQICLLLDQLPPKCRTISRLLLIDGLDHAEIASRLKVSESTVRSQKSKALHFLRLHFDRLILIISFLTAWTK